MAFSAYTSGAYPIGAKIYNRRAFTNGSEIGAEVYSGTRSQVMARLKAMENCVRAINDRGEEGDRYTPLGGPTGEVNGEPSRLGYNSNSVASTLLECIGRTPGQISLPNRATPGSDFRPLPSGEIKSVIDGVNEKTDPVDRISYPEFRTENTIDNPGDGRVRANGLNREVPAGTVDPGVAASARITEIKKMLGDSSSEYWRGSKAEGLQREYLELLTAQEKRRK